MKKLFVQCVLALLPLIPAAAQEEKGIHFEEGTFADALAKAGAENKNVFVDCYTQWCGPCKFMSNSVFPTDSVGGYMNPRYVSIKIDMEHGEGPELQKNFQVKAYPTYILFTPEGKELGRFAGSASAPDFIRYIEAAGEGKDVEALQKAERESSLDGSNIQPQEKDTIYDEGKGLNFEEITYAEALEKAKAENKRIFIDCYTSWCGPCKMMMATTFKDTRIGNLMNLQFVNLKVNMEEEGDGKALQEAFKVEMFPTYLIINPDGTEYNRFVGGGSVVKFAASLNKALLGEEDETLQFMRKQQEAMEKAREERKANLTAAPRTFDPSLVAFEKDADIDKAVKKAKKQGKEVFVAIYTKNEMADYMFSLFNEQEVADFLNNGYVNIETDAGSVEGDGIIDRYGISEVLPAFLVLDSEGELKNAISSCHGAQNFIESIKEGKH